MRDADASIRLLHVDDEPDFAEMVATFLQRHDEQFEIEIATSAAEGREKLAETDFDCIVSDHEMPGQTGIEFLRSVRADDPEIPFILFTGKGSEEVASDAIAAGVTEYLQKETGTGQYAVLANRIRNAVDKYEAQSRLADHDRRLELFFEQSPLGVIEWDETCTISRVNDAAEEILGYAEAELEGESWQVIVPDGERDTVAPVVEQLLDATDGDHSINENVRSDGQHITCEWHNRVVTDEAGEVVAIYSLFRDISDRRQQEERLETLIDNLPGMVYRCRDEEGWPMEDVRGEVESLTGYAASEIESTERFYAGEIVHPDDYEDVWNAVQNALEKGESFEVTYRIRTRDGETKWVWERGQAVDTNGQPGVIEGFVTDITGRKELIRELEQEREFVEQALDTLDDVFYVVDEDGGMRRWNSRLVEVTGYSDSDLAAMDAVDLFPDAERSRIADAIAATIETGEAVVESEFLTADGETIPYEFTGARLDDETGDRPELVGVGRDITERKAYEQRLTALHEVAADLTTIESRNEVCARTMEASQAILDFDLSVITLEDDGLLVPTAISEDIDPSGITEMAVTEGLAGKTFRTGNSYLVDDLADDPDADPQGPYESAISVAVGEYGNFQVVAEVTDAFDETDLELAELLMTHAENALDRIEREQRLAQQNQRLEEFASVVSHDLRNPLSVAKGRLELAREDGDPDREHLTAAETAVDRSLALIEDLLTLAREGTPISQLEPVPLERAVEESWSNVETAAATLAVESDRVIRADQSRVKQLFENLLRNAVEHAGDDVTVTVGDLADGFYLEDDGPGIAPHDRETVFDAGYSASADGTGFGLSIVRKIADAHGWDLRLVESDDGGARFEFENVETEAGLSR